MLLSVDSNEHGEPREEMPCPFDDVDMTGRDGVESAGYTACSPSLALAGRAYHHHRLTPLVPSRRRA